MLGLLAVSAVFQTIFSVIVAVLILLATITVHEFGHYIVGKIFKFKINEFAIGMGPAIFKKTKKNGEVFSIRIFPLGGFCAFEGEDEDNETVAKENAKLEKEEESSLKIYEEDYSSQTEKSDNVPEKKQPRTLSKDAFNNKKPWQRILVLLAGATFNFVVAVLIVMIYFTAYGHFAFQAYEVKAADSHTENSMTLQNGDVILEINDKFIYFTTDLIDALNGKKQGDIVKVKVLHENGKKETIEVSLRTDVNIDSMENIYPALDSFGVATVLHIATEENSPLHGYNYVFRMKVADEAYEDSPRLYDLNDLYERLKVLNEGDTLQLYVPDKNDEKKKELITLVAPIGYNAVDKTDRSKVLAAFGIKNEEALVHQFTSKSVRFNFFEGIGRAVVYSFKTVGITLQSFGQLLTGKLSLDAVSGPVGTITLTTQYVSHGFKYVLNIASMIGLSIAIFNLLPIPALDGARAVFVLIEWVRGKPVNRNVEGMIHFIGLIALFGFAILVDVLKLF